MPSQDWPIASPAVLLAAISVGCDYSTMLANGGHCDPRLTLMISPLNIPQGESPVGSASAYSKVVDWVLEMYGAKGDAIPSSLIDLIGRPAA